MERVKFWDLPAARQIFRLTEAMQYSLSDYNKTYAQRNEYEKEKYNYWINEVDKYATAELAQEAERIKETYAESIESNPLLSGIIDLAIKAGSASSFEEYKEIYEEYQQIQRENPIENNWQDYVDMGCILTTGYLTADRALYILLVS